MESLKEKLNPSRFPEMNPRLATLVRAILELQPDLYIDAYGLIFDEEGGFLGTRQWFTECWEDFIISPKAGLTAEEYQDAQLSFKCCRNYWRYNAPDKKPYMEKFAKIATLAIETTDNPKEIAALIVEMMSPKNRNPQEN